MLNVKINRKNIKDLKFFKVFISKLIDKQLGIFKFKSIEINRD